MALILLILLTVAVVRLVLFFSPWYCQIVAIDNRTAAIPIKINILQIGLYSVPMARWRLVWWLLSALLAGMAD